MHVTNAWHMDSIIEHGLQVSDEEDARDCIHLCIDLRDGRGHGHPFPGGVYAVYDAWAIYKNEPRIDFWVSLQGVYLTRRPQEEVPSHGLLV